MDKQNVLSKGQITNNIAILKNYKDLILFGIIHKIIWWCNILWYLDDKLGHVPYIFLLKEIGGQLLPVDVDWTIIPYENSIHI